MLTRYRIRGPLRCTGVGRLDCADALENQTRVALRWLPLEANGASAARALAALPTHPALPRILEVGEEDECAVIAMEFPEGRLLSAILGEPMAPSEVERMGGELADALANLHGRDLCHGELSPQSILTLPSRALLWDVPLVLANRLTDRRQSQREAAQLPHLAPCLSPELARGEPPTLPSDVYALGAVLALAAGARVPAESTLTLVHRIATGDWRPSVPATLQPQTRALIERALSAEPAARPFASELAAALRPAQAPLPVEPGPEFALAHDPLLESELERTEQAAVPDDVGEPAQKPEDHGGEEAPRLAPPSAEEMPRAESPQSFHPPQAGAVGVETSLPILETSARSKAPALTDVLAAPRAGASRLLVAGVAGLSLGLLGVLIAAFSMSAPADKPPSFQPQAITTGEAPEATPEESVVAPAPPAAVTVDPPTADEPPELVPPAAQVQPAAAAAVSKPAPARSPRPKRTKRKRSRSGKVNRGAEEAVLEAPVSGNELKRPEL